MSGNQGPSADALAVVRRIEASLAGGKFKVSRDSVAGRQMVIGRRPQFRPRRPGSRLHLFVLVGVFKTDASPDHLDRFLDEAAEYAATMKGLGRGAVAVAVAVVDSAEGAGHWAVTSPGRRPAGWSFPVLVDLEERRVVIPAGVGTGTMDTAQLGQLVRTHVAPSLEPG